MIINIKCDCGNEDILKIDSCLKERTQPINQKSKPIYMWSDYIGTAKIKCLACNVEKDLC